jgi:hypothetical protein
MDRRMVVLPNRLDDIENKSGIDRRDWQRANLFESEGSKRVKKFHPKVCVGPF